jgi:hypothetical protein
MGDCGSHDIPTKGYKAIFEAYHSATFSNQFIFFTANEDLNEPDPHNNWNWYGWYSGSSSSYYSVPSGNKTLLVIEADIQVHTPVSGQEYITAMLTSRIHESSFDVSTTTELYVSKGHPTNDDGSINNISIWPEITIGGTTRDVRTLDYARYRIFSVN